MTIPEAFSMHTSIIVGDIGNNAALITDNENGMKFQFDSSNDLVRTMDRFERYNVKEIGKATYMDYLENYSQDVNYKKIKRYMMRQNSGSC